MSTLAKLTLKAILINSIVLGLTFLGGFFGFHFYVKAFFYILIPLGFLLSFALHSDEFIKNMISRDDSFIIRRQSKLYKFIDFTFDFVFLGIFIYFGYKAIFVMWLILTILSASSYHALNVFLEKEKKSLRAYKK